MAGAETPMGIIPGGRGNDLARVLGEPAHLLRFDFVLRPAAAGP